MKLTVDQIEKIERKLLSDGIVYDDIKLELTDHIASEIEAKISQNNCNYETAFTEVFESWKPQFKHISHSNWVGNWISGPRIYMDKVIKISKDELKWGAIIVVIGLIVKLFNYDVYVSNEYSNIVGTSLKGTVIGFLIAFLCGRLFIIKSKFKTTYSEMYKKRVYFIVPQFFLIMMNFYSVLKFNDSKTEHLLPLLGVVLYIGFAFNSIRLLWKHLKMQKQFQSALGIS